MHTDCWKVICSVGNGWWSLHNHLLQLYESHLLFLSGSTNSITNTSRHTHITALNWIPKACLPSTHTYTCWAAHTAALRLWLNAEGRVMSSSQAQIHLFISIMNAQTNHTTSTHRANLSPAYWREEILIGTGDRSGASHTQTCTHHLTTKHTQHRERECNCSDFTLLQLRRLSCHCQLHFIEILTLFQMFLLEYFQKNTNELLILASSLCISGVVNSGPEKPQPGRVQLQP